MLEVHDSGTGRGDDRLGHDKRLAVPAVKAHSYVPGQLDVLALVLAHRNLVGVVQQNVRRLQGRVGEQPPRDEVVALRLVLELGHPAQFAEGRRALHNPGTLGVLADVTLYEQSAALGIEAAGYQQLGQ